MKVKQEMRKPLIFGALIVIAVVGIYLAFFAPPRAVANIALQINPAVTLALNDRNVVVEARGLDAGGESLLAGVNVTGQEVSEALRTVVGASRQAGLLADGQRVQMAVSGRIGEAGLTALVGTAEQTVRGYVAEQGLAVDVVVVSLTVELANAIRAAGLLPADYVDAVAEAGAPAVLAILRLQQELGLDIALFRQELSTIASALTDMKEAGITEENALAILRGAFTADPSLAELTTITAAMIDLHEAGVAQEGIMAVFGLVDERLAAGVDRALLLEEFTTITAMLIDLTVDEGLSKEEALARVRAAIERDPTLQEFDHLVEVNRQNGEADRPQPEPGE